MSTEPIEWIFNRNPIKNFSAVLTSYSGREFKSPTRSTVPLLSLIRHGTDTWGSILSAQGVNPDAKAHLEFRVDPPCGRGKASHTDVMMFSPSDSLGVEAKWTEKRYKNVKEWLGKGADNRRQVMTGWLSFLQPLATKPLEISAFHDAVYQMVHRAAATCSVSKNPKLAYVQFTPQPNGIDSDTRQTLRDLEHLHQLLGSPKNFPFSLIEVHLQPTDEYKQIRSLDKRDPRTAIQVSTALQASPLFDFEVRSTRRIGGI